MRSSHPFRPSRIALARSRREERHADRRDVHRLGARRRTRGTRRPLPPPVSSRVADRPDRADRERPQLRVDGDDRRRRGRNARPADAPSSSVIQPGGGASSSGWLVAFRAAMTRNRTPTTRRIAPSTTLVPGLPSSTAISMTGPQHEQLAPAGRRSCRRPRRGPSGRRPARSQGDDRERDLDRDHRAADRERDQRRPELGHRVQAYGEPPGAARGGAESSAWNSRRCASSSRRTRPSSARAWPG